MSRHKIVKNLDLDDELDDFDGGEDYEDGGDGLTDEDREQLRLGTIEVRETLGDSVALTDAEIQESLWHYFYDVPKTVTYLLNLKTKTTTPKKEKKKGEFRCALFGFGGGKSNGLRFVEGLGYNVAVLDGLHDLDLGDEISASTCRASAVPQGFWDDMQWLNTPSDRQAIFVAPYLPPGGLLGGSSEGAPKMSKLQALAAARKKKTQEQKLASTEKVEATMAGLAISTTDGAADGTSLPKTGTPQRTYPPRKRKDESPHEKTVQPPQPNEMIPPDQAHVEQVRLPEVETAAPSAFANTVFGESTPQPSQMHFTLPYLKGHVMDSTDAFSGPSPDDVVMAAQSKAANAKTKKNEKDKVMGKTTSEKKADQIANGVEALKIDDTPRATSKNLDVLKEYEKSKAKNAANFVVIGHVDAGKSTLMGRLLMDLDVVDQRTIDRYRKEAEKMGKSSFALAWVLDQGTEERSRGVTIDIATNKFETDKTAFTILDAPGHRDFIPNMIAGASQADFAVLVIDASTGSFESGLKGQTKEHALLVRSMGVQRLIIAINKLDTVAWSQDRFDEISQQISAFLTAAGFQPKNVSFIPMSGLHGDNIVRKIDSPDASWYTGPTLVEELDHSEPVTRALEKPLRFTVGDIFRGGVQNPLSVSGRIEAGSLQTGDALLAQPASQKAFVKSLEVDNESVDWAVAGQNVVINLSDIDPIHLKIGDVLSSPSSPIPCVKQFTIKALAFEYLVPGSLDVHRGRLHAPGQVKEMLATLDKVTGAVLRKKPRVVKPGEVARVVVDLAGSEVPLEKGMRVVLRSGGETVAAGLLE